MSAEQEREVLAAEVVVREKLDGINLGIGRVGRERLALDLRGPWAAALDGAVVRAAGIYVRQREERFLALLRPGEVIFGEWLWHRISLAYSALPDTYLAFALQRRDGHFEPYGRFMARAAGAGLTTLAPLWRGRLRSVPRLRRLVGPSRLGAKWMEGLIVERVRPGRAQRFSKWVEPGYKKVYAEDISGAKNRVVGR